MKTFREPKRIATPIKLHGVYSVADLQHMVKSIKQRMAIETHPHKQLMQVLISVENISDTEVIPSPNATPS